MAGARTTRCGRGSSSTAREILGRRLLVMLEYFSGNSPNGQFYQNKIDYIGLGAHFYHGGAD